MSTLTTQQKSDIDRLWTEFWTGGITNPLTVVEQISFLMFARMLDVTHRMSLMPTAAASGADAAGWSAALSITGLHDAYAARHGAITPANVMRFMCFDGANSSSIVSCVRAARENAHAVRGTLTGELWETLNASWLKLPKTWRVTPLQARP